MAEESTKKISFGFSKLTKLPIKSKFGKVVPSNVEYIDCLDSKTIKFKGSEGKSNANVTGLIIPLSTSSPLQKGSKLRELINSRAKGVANSVDTVTAVDGGSIINEQTDLDSIAVRELLEDVRKSKAEKESSNNFTFDLPQAGAKDIIDKESTLEDYESVPVSDYGLAMLRGMGWDASKGIGKTEKLVPTLEPKVRPRGMGLGVVLERSSLTPLNAESKSTKVEEELKIAKGGFVQVISGSKKDMYGQIEGFNEESGRLILKMALGGSPVSINEYMVKPVTKDEFSRNSRVLNVSKYNEYKNNETDNGSSKNSSEESRKRDSRGKDRIAREENGNSKYASEDGRRKDSRDNERSRDNGSKYSSDEKSRHERKERKRHRSKSRSPSHKYK